MTQTFVLVPLGVIFLIGFLLDLVVQQAWTFDWPCSLASYRLYVWTLCFLGMIGVFILWTR